MKDEVTGDYVAGGGHIGLIWVKQYSRDGLVQPINTKKPMATLFNSWSFSSIHIDSFAY